jgi:hypothetical protein
MICRQAGLHFRGEHSRPGSAETLACVHNELRLCDLCNELEIGPSGASTWLGQISDAALPTMWLMLMRLSRSFALPRDTTSWPVIGRASLPASRLLRSLVISNSLFLLPFRHPFLRSERYCAPGWCSPSG